MPLLNDAAAVYAGAIPATHVYLGTALVWPPGAGWGPDESMYRPGAQPAAPSDPSSFSLGNKITINAAGRITAVKTWHHNGSGASRFVGLWNDTGSVLLASAYSASEVNGWNITTLSTPVSVAAGETIVVTFGYYGYAADGLFPYSGDFVMDGSPHLTWVCGQYSAVTGYPETFPPNSITPNHYWADIVFQEGTAPPELSYVDRVKSLAPLNYWRLGEPPGAQSGADQMNQYACTFTGAPTLGAVGLLAGDADTAMQVSGVIGQGASAGNPADYWLQSLTLEAWIRTSNAGPSYRAIMVKQDGYGLFAVDNILSVYEWASGQAISSGIDIATGLAHHVAVVFAPTGSQMYLDGVAVGVSFNHTTQSHGYPLTIGYAQFSGQEFTGIIDEVAIYNRALTSAEIVGNYEAGRT